VKSLDFNTLVLKSERFRSSEISLRNLWREIKDVIIFLKKMIYFGNSLDFNTLVLKSRIFQDLENDRPVGRSFSWNLGIEMLISMTHFREDYA
jgi:hypothetical protein